MAAGTKQYAIALGVFLLVDVAMRFALHLTGSDFWFGEFMRGNAGGFIAGCVYWSRNPFPGIATGARIAAGEGRVSAPVADEIAPHKAAS